MISVRDIALGNIKLRKSNAEKQADLNLQELLKNEEVKKKKNTGLPGYSRKGQLTKPESRWKKTERAE